LPKHGFDEAATPANPSLRAAGEAIQLPAAMKQPAVYIMAGRCIEAPDPNWHDRFAETA
jgi:hypothetical protein